MSTKKIILPSNLYELIFRRNFSTFYFILGTGTDRDDLHDRDSFSGGQNERNYNPRDEMLRGEQKSYNSLFDKFFGGR